MTLSLGLTAAWALLVYTNAVRAQPPPFALAVPFFWPSTGQLTWHGFLAAQQEHSVRLAALLLYDVLAWAAGRRILRWSGAGNLGGITGAGAAFLLGGGAAGLAFLGAALAGLAYPLVAAGLAAAAAGMAWEDARTPGAIVAARRAARAALTRARSVSPVLALLAAVVAAGGLAGALAPEVILDATRFFLEIPRRALVLHRLVPMEGFPLALTPLFPHAISLPLFALAGETPVKLLSWQAGLLVAALLHEWLSEDRWAAPFAALAGTAWLSLLNVPILAQTAMSDLTVAAWVTFAARAQFGLKRWWLAGMLWGGALGCKYQTGAMFAASVAGELLVGRRQGLRLLVPALAVVAVWPARNWLAAGMPLYPLSIPAALAGSVHSPMPFFFLPLQWAAERTPGGMLAAPFTLSTSMKFWDSLMSPLLVALLPLAFTRATKPSVRLGLAGSLAAWAWAFGNIGRYLYPIAPLLLLEAFRGGCRLAFRRPASGAGLFPSRPTLGPLRLLLVLPLAYDAVVSFGWAARMTDPLVATLGRVSRAAYVRHYLKPSPVTFDTGLRLATSLTPSTRYYLAGELRAWGWPGMAWIDGEFVSSNLSRWAAAAPDAARLRVAFRQRGIVHLVAYEQPLRGLGYLAPGPGGWTRPARVVYRSFFARYARLRERVGDAAGSFAWYVLLARPGPPGPVPSPLPAILEEAADGV